MSQLSIIRFGSAGEIAGENMAPPPEMPMGCQRGAWAGESGGTNPPSRQSANERRLKNARMSQVQQVSPPNSRRAWRTLRTRRGLTPKVSEYGIFDANNAAIKTAIHRTPDLH